MADLWQTAWGDGKLRVADWLWDYTAAVYMVSAFTPIHFFLFPIPRLRMRVNFISPVDERS